MKNTLSGIGFILSAILCLKVCEMGISGISEIAFYMAAFLGIAGMAIVIIEFFRDKKE